MTAPDRQQQRRTVLLEACLDLVGGGGTAAVTAESVAARAKLTKRYFYENFAGRDEILVAALDVMFDELIADIRAAIDGHGAAGRAQAIAEAFVSTMCRDPRRARLYAESVATPALRARREKAIVAFTDLLADDHRGDESGESVGRRLRTRIMVSGVTDVVTNWIDGTLSADRATLTAAIVAVGGFVQPQEVASTPGDRLDDQTTSS